MNKEDLVSLNYKAKCDRLKQELNERKEELQNKMNKEEIKLMTIIKDCSYSEDGITYMSDKQYNNYIDIIEQLQQENQSLKKENKILRENAEHNDKVVDKANWENLKLKEHIEKYEHYCKTTGIEELMKENQKYKEVIDKAINNSQYWIDYYTRLNSDERIALRLQENIDILKEVEKMNKEEKELKKLNVINYYANLEKYIKKIQKENKELKDNWNKLKEWTKKAVDKYYDCDLRVDMVYKNVLDRMQELEKSDSNE